MAVAALHGSHNSSYGKNRKQKILFCIMYVRIWIDTNENRAYTATVATLCEDGGKHER